MNCHEARKMVTPFINHELPDRETEHFLHHVENCSACMDELETYFMVYRAIDMLDAGAHHRENDFQKMLGEEIRCARHGILRRRILAAFRVCLLAVAEILMLTCILIGYENREGYTGGYLFHRVLYGAEYDAGSGAGTVNPMETETEATTAANTEDETEAAGNRSLEQEQSGK